VQEFEQKRLAKLAEYNILDSLQEDEYDQIIFLASQICDTPIAIISFVDKDRQWFKSSKGLNISETDRSISFCNYAIQHPTKNLIIPNARVDKRFSKNPLVTGNPNIAFYAGFPLVVDEKYGLGTLCIIDDKPRELTKNQILGLEYLSIQVMKLLELRKNNIDLQKTESALSAKNEDLEQFAMVVAHDIKSPLASIALANEVLQNEYQMALKAEGMHMLNISINATQKIKDLVNGILTYYRAGAEANLKEVINLEKFFESLKMILEGSKDITMHYRFTSGCINMVKTELEQIFLNLLSNAIRYNDKEKVTIHIELDEDEKFYYFKVSDNGIGIKATSIDKIFNLFYTENQADLQGIKSYGIGLPTVLRIVTKQHGNISVKSTLGKGSEFSFNLIKNG
jgi:signal transduction histidine kinase